MKYKWKINDLEEYIKLLKLKLYNLLGIKDINKIDTDTLINILNNINDEETSYNVKILLADLNQAHILLGEICPYDFLEYYLYGDLDTSDNYNRKSLDIIKEHVSILDKYPFAKDDLLKARRILKYNTWLPLDTLFSMKQCNLSNDDILELTHDFYKQFDSYFFKKFMGVFKYRKDIVSFKNYDGGGTLGTCYELLCASTSYIQILRDHNIGDVTTTIHEFMHATSFSINPNHLYDPNKDFLSEFDTTFINLLATDYISQNLKTEQIYANSFNALVDHYNSINSAYILDLIKDEDITSNKDLSSFIKSHEANLEIILHYIKMDLPFYLFIYSLPFIFAVELYNIYKTDKDKAIYLLKKIINANCNSKEEYYQMMLDFGLIPGRHLNTYAVDINKKVKSKIKLNIDGVKMT